MAQDLSNLARILSDAFNNKSYDKALAILDDNVQWQNIPFHKTFSGKTGFQEYYNSWHTAFPDGKITITNLIASGSFVVVEFTGKGTNTGPLNGPMGQIPATGRNVEMPLIDVLEFKDGKLIKARTYFDAATMMHKLGLDQAKAAA